MNYKIGDIGWIVLYSIDMRPLLVKEVKITYIFPQMKYDIECVYTDGTYRSFLIGEDRFFLNKKECLEKFKEDATIYLHKLQDECILYQFKMNEVLKDE